jgi:prepilin-type N-terminal cleavage/methylation domain-containing protein
MNIKAGLQRGGAGRGFTLIELLLAMVLLLLLLGAVVFNFSSVESGARLNEGASQFEALLRLARAQAANSGRLVQVSVEDAATLDDATSSSVIRFSTETDPLGQPGVFQDVPLGQDYLERINDQVQVDSVRLPGTEKSAAAEGTKEGDADDSLLDEAGTIFPPVRFYPDGTSDSVEIVLSSRDPDDKRRVSIRLVGVTGAVRRTVMDDADTSGREQNSEEGAQQKTPIDGTADSPTGRDRKSTVSQTTAQPGAPDGKSSAKEESLPKAAGQEQDKERAR